MKFDYVIGNPPYQDTTTGENETFAPPVYDKFMDAAFTVADKVELIHPARFLSNAGSTPKEWNKKMLNDEHFKILYFEQDSSRVFSNTDIKGGIAITYRDITTNFGAIEIFSPYKELREINAKVSEKNPNSLGDIIFTQNRFDLDKLYDAYPAYRNIIGSDGKDKRFRNNIFEKIDCFMESPTTDDDISVIGVIKNKRYWRYINRGFVDIEHENLKKWKVIVPRANGRGVLGEILSTPEVLAPNQGYTQTFIGIGAFNEKKEAENLLKYIKSKFLRIMLSILKVDQHNEKDTWAYVPIQDFTDRSDIDWSKSIGEIDQQLYQKYHFSEEEIMFIETNVKEME